MKAKLQKISGNPSDKSDSIQFRLEESDMEKYGKEVLALRRYDIVKISANSDQSQISNEGSVHFPIFEFQAINTSLSVCVTETGQIATITFSYEDPKVLEYVINNHLRDQYLNLSFDQGESPYKK